MSPGVVTGRADICQDCPAPCALQRDRAAHADPCAACPLPTPRWSAWDCGSAPAPAASAPPAPAAPTFARRVRGLRAAGMLVAPALRHARRAACEACPYSLRTKHEGLYRCTDARSRCGCVGGDELRLALARSTCPRWPDVL